MKKILRNALPAIFMLVALFLFWAAFTKVEASDCGYRTTMCAADEPLYGTVHINIKVTPPTVRVELTNPNMEGADILIKQGCVEGTVAAVQAKGDAFNEEQLNAILAQCLESSNYGKVRGTIL